MPNFTFDTLDIGEENRAAYEVCRRIARFEEPAEEGPVLLLGPAGSGKSHLLWSIVEHVRGSDNRAGLALITAREFPDKVRALVTDPSPIRKGQPAILLVDDLQSFSDAADDLENVVRIFLGSRHQAVIVSRVYPDRLPALSGAFQSLLTGGKVISIERPQKLRPRQEEIVASAELERLEADLAAKEEAWRGEREALEGRLRNQDEELRALRAEAEQLRRDAEAHAGQEAQQRELARDAEEQRKQREALQEELESLRAELAEKESARETLERELTEAREEAEGAFAEQSRLQGRLGAQVEVEQALEAAREEAEALLTLIEEQAQAEAKREEEWQAQLDELRQAAAAYAPGPINAEELSALRAHADELNAELDALRKEVAARQVEAEDAQRQAEERLQEELEAAQQQAAAHEQDLSAARKQVSLQAAEMDALRHNAAQQVAAVQAEAGALENRVALLEDRLRYAEEHGRLAGAELVTLQEQVAMWMQQLHALGNRLATTRAVAALSAEREAPPEDQPQLFDYVPLEALVERLDLRVAPPPPPPAHESQAAPEVEVRAPEEAAASDDEQADAAEQSNASA